MPGGDRTGPLGQGARTGRGLGACGGGQSRADVPAAGQGRGMGRGIGGGRGGGRLGGGGRGQGVGGRGQGM
ncbi:MAG TPA: DUF5320 family protein, partial [Kiritimatiellia bacterium]|nr:DUF5320 family protein [Kiritimatiellia bacterium]